VKAPPEAVPVNIRVIGALGPPPPYRPADQAAPVFARGPAPDLEPWREPSLACVLTDEPAAEAAPAEPHWSLIREPDATVEVAPPPGEQTRSEIDQDLGRATSQ